MWNNLSILALWTGLIVLPAGNATAPARSHEQRIAITVTTKGFEPSTVQVKAGQPIVLVVTRKTERTCAKEIVISARKPIRRELPLDQPVAIRMEPQKSGTVRYACGMDMVSGKLVIR